MNQQELLDKADRYLPGACFGALHLPPDLRMVMVRGHGSKIYDAAGKQYIDYVLGSGPLLLGHGRPEIVDAVLKQVNTGSTFFALNEPAILLAETICEAVPCAEAIRFQTTGSEATFAAVRLARAFTGKEKVLKFEGGWHGGHDLGQLSGAPGEPPPFPEAMPDCDGIPISSQGDVVVAPFNDAGAAAALIEEHHRELACVIVEPLQRSLKPEPGFLETLRKVTKKYGILLIYDEVVTGFRIAWGGAQERYGIVPDLACYGKAMAGGYPLSAVVGRKDLMTQADPRQKGQAKYCFLSGTLTANPIACAAGLAALGVLRQASVYERLRALGQRLAQGIGQAGAEVGVPVQVLGDGPVLQLYFTAHRPLRNHRDLLRADQKKAILFGYELIRRGIYCTPGGKLYLSLAHTDSDIDRTAATIAEAMKTIR